MTLIIAEAGINHNGDIEIAKDLIKNSIVFKKIFNFNCV